MIRHNSLISRLEDNQWLRFGHSSASALSACQRETLHGIVSIHFIFIKFMIRSLPRVSNPNLCHSQISGTSLHLAGEVLLFCHLSNWEVAETGSCKDRDNKMAIVHSVFCVEIVTPFEKNYWTTFSRHAKIPGDDDDDLMCIFPML